jgi:hypothetical protein
MSPQNYSTINDLIGYYQERMNKDNKNIERVKRFYNDDDSFDRLMERLMQKDLKRFENLIKGLTDEEVRERPYKFFPTPWKLFFIILEIVQVDGTEVPAFDTLTRSYSSKNMIYHGWTFSWVHGENALISIFNRKDELVYRF